MTILLASFRPANRLQDLLALVVADLALVAVVLEAGSVEELVVAQVDLSV